MGKRIIGRPTLPDGFAIEQMADGKWYRQRQDEKGAWRAVEEGGDPANQEPPHVVGYGTLEEAARACWRAART